MQEAPRDRGFLINITQVELCNASEEVYHTSSTVSRGTLSPARLLTGVFRGVAERPSRGGGRAAARCRAARADRASAAEVSGECAMSEKPAWKAPEMRVLEAGLSIAGRPDDDDMAVTVSRLVVMVSTLVGRLDRIEAALRDRGWIT